MYVLSLVCLAGDECRFHRWKCYTKFKMHFHTDIEDISDERRENGVPPVRFIFLLVQTVNSPDYIRDGFEGYP